MSNESKTIENFNHNWKRSIISKHGADEIFLSCDYDDHHSVDVTLPDHQSEGKSNGFCYQKRFQFDYQLNTQSQVFLSFSPDDNEDSVEMTQVPAFNIWLNGESICDSDSFNPWIEITNQLKISSENVIVIYSLAGYSFPFYVTLIIQSTPVNFLENKRLDYTASLNHTDGLVDLVLGSYDCIHEEEVNDYELSNEWVSISQEQMAEAAEASKIGSVPRLSIVMLIVGTRGDVQPFIAFGKTLLKYGHRVRLATHETFAGFVYEHGLEFYPLAGDPADLMSFMVKNSGVFPSISSVTNGDVRDNREIIDAILFSTWKACIEPDPQTGTLFRADAIIANPPAYGHIHCAEKLQIPLHIMFTMPWSPTESFPHPLCRIVDQQGTKHRWNRLSYTLMDTVIWSGLGDLINRFREDILELPPLHTRTAVRMMNDEFVPHTYCWSPSLVPKPPDWPNFLSISGFFFLDLATNFQAPEDLKNFLAAGEKPIYIGFGSITGHDSVRLSKLIVEALKITGFRAILSNLATNIDVPKNIFRIGNCPHDWLFQHVSAVCHHGGAGTTAAGLRAGKPTIIVPFFGDQFFWGSMIHERGAGPLPIPGKDLTCDQFIEALKFVRRPEVCRAAQLLGQSLSEENGCERALESFHANLPLNALRSDLEQTFAASIELKDYQMKVSPPVATVLLSAGLIKEKQLTPYSTRTWSRMVETEQSYLPFRNFLYHEQRAFKKLFPNLFKPELPKDDPLVRRKAGSNKAESIFKGVGHAWIGCLAFYGDVTDALEHLPQVYDPYAESDHHQNFKVEGFRGGVKAAGKSLLYGVTDGVTGLVKKPCLGYRHDGIRGAATGAALAVPNVVLKPITGTLASVTWLSRGIYAAGKNFANRHKVKQDNRLNLIMVNNPRRSMENLTEDASREHRAAAASGFNVNVCQNIIEQFEMIVRERSRLINSSKAEKKSSFDSKQRSASYNNLV